MEKQLIFIQPFNGEPGTLPSFLATVDQVLDEFGVEAEQAFIIIYNEKITRAATNYLAAEAPTTWEESKEKLKIHYRPTKDPSSILRDINNIKVFTITHLLDKIQEIINNITECAAFNVNGLDIANCLNSALILKIKDISAGAFASEIHDKYTITDIRTFLYKYIGHDKYIFKCRKDTKSTPDTQNTILSKTK